MKHVFNSNIFKFSKKSNELSTDISSLERANNKFNVYKHSNFIIQCIHINSINGGNSTK